MSSSTFFFCWFGATLLATGLYILLVTGRLYCAGLFIGHIWATLKEEVRRTVKVIRDAVSRKGMSGKREIELDEYERHLS